VSNSFSQPAYRGKEELLRAIADDDPHLSVMIIAAALEERTATSLKQPACG
jgi:hypothetical protein